ncbi:hypothetical protein Taro_014648 [Colocasia esculenta]|uniref:Uncharacterized protein n=1 Tax=Colocasia esculenta TaxID=4460 RepID=A0A843U9K3_COLES|nr:hypothetical protein [Colocasia esculenta]
MIYVLNLQVYTALVIDGVDTSIDGVDTGSLFLEFFHEDRVQCVDTAPGSHARKIQEHSGRRQEEREKGICIQRSRAVPPREEEGEEEKVLVIAAVPVQKEIQPKLGSIVIQRFEYFVLWFGAIMLWCLRRSAQGLVNLLNSQVVYGVGCRAYLLGFFEL